MSNNKEMQQNIIWVDEDQFMLEPYVEFLQRNGFKVEFCTSLTKGEELIRLNKYDLLILDAMIPLTEEEENGPYKSTELGKQAGLVFFKRVKSILDEQRTPILILTQRLDSGIREKFLANGLPEEAFARKVDIAGVKHLLSRINKLLSG